MQRSNSWSLIAASVLGLCSLSAHAGSIDLLSLNCGSSAITIGMTLEQIEKDCDASFQPAYVSEHTRPIPTRLMKDDLTHDVFQKRMYYPAEQQTTHVILRNGVVVRIFAQKPHLN